MEFRYEDVVCRAICRAERRLPTDQENTPLVITPSRSSSVAFLQEFLRDNSKRILIDVARYGAVLLRGFDIESAKDLERCILNIQGMRGMRDILFQLPGRKQPIQDTQFVYPTSITSRKEKTGGTLKFELFHTENYGFPDIPSYLAFHCVTPCRLGGETGMVNTAHLYAGLSDGLKRSLETTSCLVELHSVVAAARKYSITIEEMTDFIQSIHLQVVQIQGKSYVAIYKPNVLEHPITREPTLSVNFNWVPGLQEAVVDVFLKDYTGIPWIIHRMAWRNPWYRRLLQRLKRPDEAFRDDIYVVADSPVPDTCSLSSLFATEDLRSVASLMRHCYSSFLWKSGDVLLVDNLKMAHTGMPGVGARVLEIMMCNPLWVPTGAADQGRKRVSDEHSAQECLGQELTRFHSSRNSPASHAA